MINNEPEETTKDTFYNGKVVVFQNKKGYRFSVDAPILADFLPFEPARKALEIGTGSGIISLLALHKNKFSFIYGMEIQESLGRLAEINGERNGFSDRFKVIIADFKKTASPPYNKGRGKRKKYRHESFQGINDKHMGKDFSGIKHIFSNPPFLQTDIGRLSPNKEIRDAKFETELNLGELLTTSFFTLDKRGSLYLILPYSRFAELECFARNIGYFIFRTRLIFSFKDGKPERFLVQLTNHKVSPVNLEPLVIFKEKGLYTEEMENIFAGR